MWIRFLRVEKPVEKTFPSASIRYEIKLVSKDRKDKTQEYFWNEVLPQTDKQLWISNATGDKSKCGSRYRYLLKNRG
ncbi:hypothetical protein CH375_21190 [Leptospira ellisii]|uniref:Uncharacterized protein n=1 Tax=Leptospira ellisii TaxID=2023197 RepID=A0A2N0BFE2_9LEPT|nr:hypothetical protein CH379_08795 [Leptospira ellisii]PKA02735.1 hypothetical protein CH375_21190 [Leptospira ellisii]